jgi:hypothetical protein
MADERSLGELAFLTYQRRLHNLEEMIPLDYPRPFRFQSATVRAAWEAAAEAVRAAVLQLTPYED